MMDAGVRVNRRRSTAAFALVAALALAAPASAQDDADAALEAIREQVLHADYRAALEAVQAFVDRDDLDAAQHAAGLEVLATIHIALRHEADAEAALARLYARDPGHRLSDADASPPVIAAFGRARANPPAPLPVSIEDRTTPLEARRSPTIVVELAEGADLVSEVRLSYRQGEGGFIGVVMALDGASATARIPVLDEAESYPVEYAVEARAPSGHVLARVGSESEPVRLMVPARPAIAAGGGEGPTGSTDEGGDDGIVIGVVLGVAGALLVAGGIVAAVVIAGEVSGPQDGSLGNIDLPLLRF